MCKRAVALLERGRQGMRPTGRGVRVRPKPRRRRSSGGPALAQSRRSIRGARHGREALPGRASNLESANAANPTSDFNRFIRAALLLLGIGVTAGLACRNLSQALVSALQAPATMQVGVMIGVCAALATGIRLPQRFGAWLCVGAWQRFLPGIATDVPSLAVGGRTTDRTLVSIVLSVAALMAGVGLALSPFLVRFAGGITAWLHHEFFWSRPPLIAMHILLAWAVTLPAMLFVGVMVSFAHRLLRMPARWDTQATALLILGASCGWLMPRFRGILLPGSTSALLATALLALIVAALIGARETGHGDREAANVSEAALPQWSERHPSLLRAGIVLVALCAVCVAGSVFDHAVLVDLDAAPRFALLTALLASGMLIGARPKRNGLRSVGGFGVACSIAGVTVLALPWLTTAPSPDSPLVAGLILMPVAVVGFALAYGHQALLHRVARRAAVGAMILSRVLWTAPAIAWGWETMGRRVLGQSFVLAPAVALAGLGAALVWFDPLFTTRRRRSQLVAVSAALLLILVTAISTWGVSATRLASITP